MRFYIASLGCPKNLVDAHSMVRLLGYAGHEMVDNPRQADVLVVNTCGFIDDARQESIGELRKLADRKRGNQILIASGCLPELWGARLKKEVSGLDGLLSTRRWSEIMTLVQDLRGERKRKSYALLGDPPLKPGDPELRVATQGTSAYLKIADGCSAACAFCAIPLIKGPAKSRPADLIVQDAVDLVDQGVHEIVLIAQDTTAYGQDRGEKDALSGLVQAILDAALDLPWLRLMYAYPGRITPHLIEVMSSDPRICHYLDLPLQHAHPHVLKRMKRPANVDRTRQLLDQLRTSMPDLALRTSFIVGYPGETESEFERLLDFVQEIRFDRLGVFVYSREEGTAAASLPDDLSTEVKAERYERLMALQQGISFEINQTLIGQTLDVLFEGQGDGLSVGRTYRDAPEIDGLVLVPGEWPVGVMAPVTVTEAMEYDLMGEMADARGNG